MTKMRIKGAALTLLAIASVGPSPVGCTSSKSSSSLDEPVASQAANDKQGKADTTHAVRSANGSDLGGKQSDLSGPPKPVRDPNCVVLNNMPHDPPVYLAGYGLVITRIMEACVAMDGRRGYMKKTPWLAMGFPCTGGSGRIDIKGNYLNPKLVSFIIGTDCLMAPQGHDQLKKIAALTVSLPHEARLMAHTPFVVQFWEVPGMTDADTGYAVELRSAPALEGIWKKFRENQNFRVRLFGRENTWAPGGHFYQVDADLKLTGRTAFQLQIVSVKNLNQVELMQVKKRCESLKPERNCAAVF